MAEQVGGDGKVYCRDIGESHIQELKKQIEEKSISNMDAAISAKDNVELPSESIDVALLSDVFQFVVHQGQTEGFCESLFESMKPGGIVVVTYVTSSRLFSEDWKQDFDATFESICRQGL